MAHDRSVARRRRAERALLSAVRGGASPRQIQNDADTQDVIELLRLNYDRANARDSAPPQVA